MFKWKLFCTVRLIICTLIINYNFCTTRYKLLFFFFFEKATPWVIVTTKFIQYNPKMCTIFKVKLLVVTSLFFLRKIHTSFLLLKLDHWRLSSSLFWRAWSEFWKTWISFRHLDISFHMTNLCQLNQLLIKWSTIQKPKKMRNGKDGEMK
jgi:hypothetical protein